VTTSHTSVVVRSIVFNVLFYFNLTFLMIVTLPTWFLPQWYPVQMSKLWGTTSLWLLRVICGVKVEWRGLEKLPPGAVIVAAKHQSAWDTFALITRLDNPTAVVKRELMWIPLFGWYMWRCGIIPVDRGAGREVMARLIERTRAAMRRGQQLVLFPEGTRRAPGAEPDYKLGIVQIYAACETPCVPVALNSGLFWPRRSFLRYPGTIVVEILDPIPAGLQRGAFFRRMTQEIEAATARLVAEGERERQRAA
jgi:1-acyl-sn-glycerol-3-phosphate acyltransferase